MMASQTEQMSLIEDALEVWSPTWPRRVTTRQFWADSPPVAVRRLQEAESTDSMEPFVSVYSFPDGHTKEGNVPHIDTLFIDFDIEGREYVSGSGDRAAWQRDLSFLLVRVGMVAETLLDNGATGWRAALSGHKGVHLFLDFPAVSSNAGEFEDFIAGVNEYARELTSTLIEESGVSDLSGYIDVTSADLGRLCRVPNTLHGGATESFGEERYCVPVALGELTDMTPWRYEELTRQPQPLPVATREENENAGDIVERHVLNATPGVFAEGKQPSYADYTRYREYINEVQNPSIELGDVKLLTSDRPCVWDYHLREDKFQHGYQSHYMEMFCIRELQEKNVPVKTMKAFFANAPEYDEAWTENRIKQVLSYGYNRFNVISILEKAPEFANPDGCEICRRAKQAANINL